MKDLTTGEAAEMLSVAPVTVRLWCRQGKFPNAYSEDTPRGVVWYIPRGDLNGIAPSKPGPKPKVNGATKSRGAAKKNGKR